MRPSARLPGRVLAVLCAALMLAGCKSDLYTNLQEREANEMLALLLNHGIGAHRVTAKDGTSAIQVEETQIAAAIDLLKSEGLPRQSFKNLGEVFKGSGLIASPTEERARYVYALSEELSRTISDIDGVLSARIHVVLPKNDLLRQDTTPSSASVFIRHDAKTELTALLPQIKMLVANSIEGLAYDKVAVVFVPVASSGAATGAPAAQFGMSGSSDTSQNYMFWALVATIGAAVSLALGTLGFAAYRLFGRRARAGGDAAALERTPPKLAIDLLTPSSLRDPA